MIGELLAAVVAPEDLLGDQVLDAAVLQDLRQRRRVAKGVGQPQDLAVDAQLLPELGGDEQTAFGIDAVLVCAGHLCHLSPTSLFFYGEKHHFSPTLVF